MKLVHLGKQLDAQDCTSSYLHQSQLKISASWAGITSLTPGAFTSHTLNVWSPETKRDTFGIDESVLGYS